MESIELTINQLNGQIEQAQMEINRLQAEIEDTELSQENAKSLRTDFDRFIEISRQNSRPVSSMLPRSVESFFNHINTLLNGGEYNHAVAQIDEIDQVLAVKLKKLYEDLEYYRQNLAGLNSERDSCNIEYQAIMAAQSE